LFAPRQLAGALCKTAAVNGKDVLVATLDLIVAAPFVHAPVAARVAPGRRPQLAFANVNGNPASSKAAGGNALEQFKQAMAGSGVRMDVYRWNLHGAPFSVFAFQLNEREKHYWSHKPGMWEAAARTELYNPMFPGDALQSLDFILGGSRAAPIRDQPFGPNVQARITTNRGVSIDQDILFGMADCNSTNEDIKDVIKFFITACKDPRVRMLYKVAMESTMRSKLIVDDVSDTGPYWQKLGTSLNNIVFNTKTCLNEMFMDQTIDTIIGHMYPETAGQAPSMWPVDVRKFGYGAAAAVHPAKVV
jgi:hypothetical protein